MPTFYTTRAASTPTSWLRRVAAVLVAAAMIVAAGVGASALEKATRSARSPLDPAALHAVDIPAPPDGRALMEQAGGDNRLRRFACPLDATAVAAFYNEALTAQGWKPLNPRDAGADPGILAFARGAQLGIISLSPGSEAGQTIVTVAVRDMRGLRTAGPPYHVEETQP